MAKNNALGKGLGALIGKNPDNTTPTKPDNTSSSSPDGLSTENVRKITLNNIVASPLQPRRQFLEEELSDLTESIRQHGIIQPLIVRPVTGNINQFELIAGERRWRASTLLGLETVPVIVRNASDQDVLEMALIENLQRQDLNPMEEAQGYVRLANEFSLKQDEIAKHVGKARASVANAMRLLDLHEDVQSLVSARKISMGHAKAILGLKEHSAQKAAAQNVISDGLTVRATERLVQDFHKKKNPSKANKGKAEEKSPLIIALENKLEHHFSTRVKMKHKKKKGRIEIEYYGNDDLQRLLDQWGIKTDDL